MAESVLEEMPNKAESSDDDEESMNTDSENSDSECTEEQDEARVRELEKEARIS